MHWLWPYWRFMPKLSGLKQSLDSHKLKVIVRWELLCCNYWWHRHGLLSTGHIRACPVIRWMPPLWWRKCGKSGLAAQFYLKWSYEESEIYILSIFSDLLLYVSCSTDWVLCYQRITSFLMRFLVLMVVSVNSKVWVVMYGDR